MSNITKKEEKRTTPYNPVTAKLAKENVLLFANNYPDTDNQDILIQYKKEATQYLKVYDLEWKAISDLNKTRLETSKFLSDKIVLAKKQINLIEGIKHKASIMLSHFADQIQQGNELELWNQYLKLYSKYTTYTFSQFESLCAQKQRVKEQKLKEQIAAEEERQRQRQNNAEPDPIVVEKVVVESIVLEDIAPLKTKMSVAIDFEKVDAVALFKAIVAGGYADKIVELARLSLKHKPVIDGVGYIETIVK
jgi:hypothetical protein